MPTKAKTFKPRHATGKTHRPREARGHSAQRGYDWTWRRFRARLIKSDPLRWLTCEHCHTTVADPSLIQLDHIVPLAEGGARLDPDNCRPLCGSCHSKRHRGNP